MGLLKPRFRIFNIHICEANQQYYPSLYEKKELRLLIFQINKLILSLIIQSYDQLSYEMEYNVDLLLVLVKYLLC